MLTLSLLGLYHFLLVLFFEIHFDEYMTNFVLMLKELAMINILRGIEKLASQELTERKAIDR